MACRLVGAKPLFEPMLEYCSNLWNKIQWNLNRNLNIFIHENAFEIVVCEMPSILSRPQCVNIRCGLPLHTYLSHSGQLCERRLHPTLRSWPWGTISRFLCDLALSPSFLHRSGGLDRCLCRCRWWSPIRIHGDETLVLFTDYYMKYFDIQYAMVLNQLV